MNHIEVILKWLSCIKNPKIQALLIGLAGWVFYLSEDLIKFIIEKLLELVSYFI